MKSATAKWLKAESTRLAPVPAHDANLSPAKKAWLTRKANSQQSAAKRKPYFGRLDFIAEKHARCADVQRTEFQGFTVVTFRDAKQYATRVYRGRDRVPAAGWFKTAADRQAFITEQTRERTSLL